MQQDFAKNLIKGKIGEAIFDQMFREQEGFTVIPFGYDRIIPEILQYTKESKNRKMLDNIRAAPDFALVSHNKKEILLVEVKYRKEIDIEELIETAKKIEEKWKFVWMFVCTSKGFYFDQTSEIIKNKKLTLMDEKWIDKKLQEKYLNLLKDFINYEGRK